MAQVAMIAFKSNDSRQISREPGEPIYFECAKQYSAILGEVFFPRDNIILVQSLNICREGFFAIFFKFAKFGLMLVSMELNKFHSLFS
jgi:hypothetical protein